MEEMYQTLRTTHDSPENPPISPENPPISPENNLATTIPPSDHYQNLLFSTATMEAPFAPESRGGEVDRAKAKIASHPLYSRLLRAFIDCQKVGVSPEIACLLDEIGRDLNDLCTSCCYGTDPELDEFMEVFCGMLVKYKSDLARPFDEASTFLSKMEAQLNNLCTGTVSSICDECAASSEEEPSVGEVEAQEAQRSGIPDIKDRLLRKFGSHIGTLKREFSKKKKKGKLPKEARQSLLEWWNVHYKWPYPTEADKIALAESTGLDQRQINNWFINQRKRHWKPSENLHLALMDNISARFSTDD